MAGMCRVCENGCWEQVTQKLAYARLRCVMEALICDDKNLGRDSCIYIYLCLKGVQSLMSVGGLFRGFGGNNCSERRTCETYV